MVNASTPRATELTLAFVVSLSAVAIDVSIPAIPSAISGLGADDSYGQLIIATYLFGYATGQIPFGLLADRYGRLPALYSGLGLFLVASIATVVAPNIFILLAARCLQGFGGAAAAVIARAIARDISEGSELARLTAVLVAALAIATLVAPLIGSAVISVAEWRSVFAVSLVMGVTAIYLVRTCLQETRRGEAVTGSVTSQLKTSFQAFLHSRTSIWAATIVGLTFFAYMGIVAGIAQVAVDAYGISSVAIGFVFSGAVVFYVAAGRIGARFARKKGAGQVLRFGILGFGIAAVTCSFTILSASSSFWVFWIGLIPFFCGMGLVFPSATAITLEPLPNVAGFAASILGTFQILAGVAGAAVTSFFYDGSNISLLAVVVTGSIAAVLVYPAGCRE